MSASATFVQAAEQVRRREPTGLGALVGYCRRNPQLVAGVVIVGALLLVGPVGSHFVDVRHAQPLSELPGQPLANLLLRRALRVIEFSGGKTIHHEEGTPTHPAHREPALPAPMAEHLYC